MPVRSVQPVTVADGWKGRRGVSIRKRSGDGLPASECGAPAARAIRTAWPAHAGGAARRAGRRVWKKFLCIFWETDSGKFVCRISVSPPLPPQIGAHPPPPLRGPLPGFCGERRSRRGTGRPARGAGRGACGAARSAQASAHPRFAAPSPNFAASAARGAEPGGPRAGRGACGAARIAQASALPRYAAPSRISRRAPFAARNRAARARRGAERAARRGSPRRQPSPATLPPPGFRGERRARGGARSMRRGAARRAQASAHPRYAAPSPDFAASAVRGAEPGGPRARGGVVRAARKPTPATLPPPRCSGRGRA
jgi:hypothetical protein